MKHEDICAFLSLDSALPVSHNSLYSSFDLDGGWGVNILFPTLPLSGTDGFLTAGLLDRQQEGSFRVVLSSVWVQLGSSCGTSSTGYIQLPVFRIASWR